MCDEFEFVTGIAKWVLVAGMYVSPNDKRQHQAVPSP